MRVAQLVLALGMAAGLAACDNPDTVSRAAPGSGTEEGPAFIEWTVRDVRVDVPERLVVSEENVYYPIADIVWRGDIEGNRRTQVGRIVDAGVLAGMRHLEGPRPVNVDVELLRFHSLTEKARYSMGGVHSIRYRLSVVDAETGEILFGPRRVVADLRAYGGQEAVEAELEGRTQKKRILSHIAGITRAAFSLPEPVEAPAGLDRGAADSAAAAAG